MNRVTITAMRTVQTEVKAYAGASYPERPLSVRWQGRWRTVRRVESEHREPDRRCFTVLMAPELGADDIRMRLCYHYANDAWQAEQMEGKAFD